MVKGCLLVLTAILGAAHGADLHGQDNRAGQSNTAGINSPCLALDVAAPNSQPREGRPIDVQITVTNISGKEIYLSYAKTDTVYRAFNVLLEIGGQEAETTALHRKIRGKQRPDDPPEVLDSGSMALPLAAGASFTWKLDLKELYDISKPGHYSLSVGRIDDCSRTVDRSKVVHFDVLPN